MSEYDQKVYDDDTTNRLKESLDAFKMILDPKNEKNIGNKRLMLIFTKIDIFQYKIEKYQNFVDFFPEYKGKPDNVTEGVRYIQKQFFLIYQQCRKSKDIEDIVINSLEINDIKKLLKFIEKNL